MNNLRIIRPPELVHVQGKIVYLDGPIRGVPDWQSQAIDMLSEQAVAATIVSPRPVVSGRSLTPSRQAKWEEEYKLRSYAAGVTVVWLAKQSVSIDDMSDTDTVFGDLGVTMVRHKYAGSAVAVGIEPGFHGANYVKRRMERICPDVSIAETLQGTCSQVALILRNSTDT